MNNLFSIEPFSVFEGMTVSIAKIFREGAAYERESWKKIWTLQDSCKMTEILQESTKNFSIFVEKYPNLALPTKFEESKALSICPGAMPAT